MRNLGQSVIRVREIVERVKADAAAIRVTGNMIRYKRC